MSGAPLTAVSKYLGRYAEPETDLARAVAGKAPYACSLVVPALAETGDLVEGYHAAAAALQQTLATKVLCVLIVNASEGRDYGLIENQRLMAELYVRARSVQRLCSSAVPTRRAWLLEAEPLDVLLVDRSSEGARLPPKTGVGLARKIGADLALALFAQGTVRSPWIFCTDADTELPGDYFVRGLAHGARLEAGLSALVFDFEHVPAGDAAVARETAWYEASLRYLALGLHWAGSPYDYHPIGSLMAVDACRYAEVRGFPRRAAGEDFYLLNKLAKVGTIRTVVGPRVQIRARLSARAPFGTGAAVQLSRESQVHLVYHAALFEGLRRWLGALETIAKVDGGGGAKHLEGWPWVAPVAGHLASSWSPLIELRLNTALSAYAAELEVQMSLDKLCRGYRAGRSRRRALHTWFDRFRTLKFMHALRAAGLPDVCWSEALASAAHVPQTLSCVADLETELLGRLREFETLVRWGAGTASLSA